ncbi:MAG: cell division protein FtsA [Candidatus Gracilibacteria bacterium]|nr:cell division protein FtsA [Candidatus Gracilibacteria bacterium]
MSFENTITSIDIGSSRIRTIIGSFLKDDNENFVVLGVGNSASTAMRKGNILDMEDFKDNLDKSLLEAEKMAGEQITGAYVSFNSSSYDVIVNKGVIAISGDEISPEDVDRVLDMAKSGVDMPNKEILKVIPEYFVVDLEDGVKNPVGMSARKLEVVAHIFTMNSNVLNNIKKAIGDVGIEILDIYPNLLNSPEGVLSKRQKELGVVCVDMGASTTGVTVYEEGVLIHSAVIPLGGDNVTNDIALGARVSIDVAERLKIEYSEIISDEINFKDKTLDLRKIGLIDEGEISLQYLSSIVSARYEEILQYVKKELSAIGKDGMLPEGAVLVGGASKEKGLIELSRDILKLPSFIGIPSINDELVDTTINDPSFAAVVGNLLLANKYGVEHHGFSINFKGILNSIAKIFKKIMP